MIRVAAGRSRSVIPVWAAIRWLASSSDAPRPTIRSRWAAASQVISQTSVAHLGEAALDQLDRLDDDDIFVFLVGDRDGRQDPRPDRRMDDRLQVPQRCRVREDDPAQCRAVERSVVAQQARTEPRDDRVERWLPDVEDVPGDRVGVDDDDARPLGQPARDRGLAAADRPGEADPERSVWAGRPVRRHGRSVGRDVGPTRRRGRSDRR